MNDPVILPEVDVNSEKDESLPPSPSSILAEISQSPNDSKRLVEKAQATKTVLNQIETQTKSCTSLIQDWISKVKSGEYATDKGLSFLEMKNQTLLNYLISLTGLILNKCSGKSIQGSSFHEQLIETRIVLEKIRPIDQKLKYQIDKLVRIAVDGKVEANDPLRYKANPNNMAKGNQDLDSDESSEEDEDVARIKDGIRSGGVYRPPKVAPQHFDEELPKGKAGSTEKVKRKVFNRTLIRELQEEYLQTPVEVHNAGDAFAKQFTREARNKERYEETFMTRLPVTKKDKHNERSMSTVGVIGDELIDFSGKRKQSNSNSSSKKGKKRKSGGKGKGAGGKKRRKH